MKISTSIEKTARLPEKKIEKITKKCPKTENKKADIKKITTFILFNYCHGLLSLIHYYGVPDGNHHESSQTVL